MNALQQLSQPTARLLLALIFIVSGYGKIAGYAGTQAYMEAMGVPGMLLPLVIALELVGGLAILVGWKTRAIAFLLAGFSVVSGLLFHFNPDDQIQMIMLMKNVAIAGGFLLLVAHGAGAYSLDNRSA
ncbi:MULTISPECIES: DoxX family protein [unclassified Agarivorans]|uniref:DoxX family protein n=1 Tax=unclassified Agarivorans TaxID=2636026 RepID=UPI0026E127F7|nr:MULTISPECIES: DoxX family protein [unclassified Agarivorans]MDO6685775.1 DoxX family protein [Agarivorans sp. 3_MG-2023]MDO6716110.1 DoxX family protein [Agarivorans sp. 2_MG-2023]